MKRLPRFFIRRDEVLDLHLQRQSDTAKLILWRSQERPEQPKHGMRLLEFAGSEDEVARCYFVTEGFSDLRDPEWHLPIKCNSAEEAQ